MILSDNDILRQAAIHILNETIGWQNTGESSSYAVVHTVCVASITAILKLITILYTVCYTYIRSAKRTALSEALTQRYRS